jgi:hypothetical protein
MTIKSQLHACREALMAGLRAAERADVPDTRVMATLRACLDVVEHLEHWSDEVSASQVDTALAVVERAAVEFGTEPVAAHAVLVAVRNAVGRLQRLRTELES